MSTLLLVSLACALGAPATEPEKESDTASFQASSLTISGLLLDADRLPHPGRVSLLPLPRNYERLSHLLAGSPGPDPVARATADDDGRFLLSAPAPGVWSVVAEAPGRVPMRYLPVPTTEPVELPPLELADDAGIDLHVRWRGGDVAADAGVLLSSDSPDLWAPLLAEGWQAHARIGWTDSRGRLSLPRLHGEALRAHVFAGGRWAEAVIAGEESRVEILLDPSSSDEGQVLEIRDEAGGPTEGVVVTSDRPSWPVGITDRAGRVRMPSCRTGPFGLHLADGRRLSLDALPATSSAESVVVDLAAQPPAEGKVVDAATGKPLGSALVWPGDDPGAFVQTDAEGLYRIAPRESRRAWVQAEASGFLPRAERLSQTAASGRAPLIRLERSSTRRGRVVDTARSPLANVVVVAAEDAEPGRDYEAFRRDPKSSRAVSGADGRFELRGLATGLEFEISASRSGFAPLVLSGVVIEPGSGPVDLGDLTLRRGVWVSGRVLDFRGHPIEGAHVWLGDVDRLPGPGLADRLRDEEPEARTDAAGRFAIEDLPAGHRAHVLVAGRGYLPAWITGVEAPPGEPLEVVLEPASGLRGLVETEVGEPVQGAIVRLRSAPPPVGTVGVGERRPVNSADERTGEDGTYAFDELAPGRIVLQALAEGFLPGDPVEIDVPSQRELTEVRLVLQRGATVEGQVTTTEGEPVEGAQIRIGPARSASDGEGLYRLSGVPLGIKAIVVSHRAYKQAIEEIDVQPGFNRFDLTVERGREVSGRVVDDRGRSQPGATVTLRNRGERGPGAFQAIADRDARFEILGVVDGRFDLEARAEGFARSLYPELVEVAGADVGGLEIVLHRGARLSGRILGIGLEEISRVEVSAELGELPPRLGTLDHRGHFEIRHLEPGEWRLRARLTGGQREATAWVGIAADDREVVRDLELGRGLLLEGLVVFEDQPLHRARVRISGLDVRQDRNVQTDYRGGFRVEGLEPGRYRIEVVQAERMLSQSQDLEIHSDREIVIEMTAGVLTGFVVAADTGDPLPDALVYLRRFLGNAEPGPLTTVGTDRRGSFVTASLAPGRYHVTVRRDGYAAQERQVEVEAGVATEPLRVELEPSPGMGLTIRRQTGPAPNRATIAILDAHGNPAAVETPLLSEHGHGYLQQIQPGTWTLLIQAQDSAPTLARVTVPGERLEVTLLPAAPLTVRVPELIESDVAGSLTIISSDGTPYLSLGPDGMPRNRWSLVGGATGVADLPAGTWELLVTASDGRVWTESVLTNGDTPTTVDLE